MTWIPRAVKLRVDPSDPAQFSNTLVRVATMREPRLFVNCEHLDCLRTHGVGHLASQLLLLHHGGARVRLYNVSPTLFRTLHLLRLDTVFEVLQASGKHSDEASHRTATA
ncbi:STAS domain-containing protein [Hymenobacter radiodurans]|uniref:STAS domain-containing protein n=1 Tax=Hymenobacter radiodurans TaxID=2496028 RepID=UPI0010585200|nr:STAS domain-containing protein [Hymenobacter radiodurans]